VELPYTIKILPVNDVFYLSFIHIFTTFYFMPLSQESLSIMALWVAETEHSIQRKAIAHPMGAVFQKKNKITREQVERFVNEIREKILFPTR